MRYGMMNMMDADKPSGIFDRWTGDELSVGEVATLLRRKDNELRALCIKSGEIRDMLE